MALPPIYDPEAVKPMEEELSAVGVKPLRTPEDVEKAIKKTAGTTLVVINSVCGCAAGNARPGVALALQHETIPDHLTTVFAGVDRDAVERVRGLMSRIPPSSPCIALFKDGELVHALPRGGIEQMSAEMVAQDLSNAFDRHCSRKGPSVSKEEFEKSMRPKVCGSTIPRM